MLDCLGTLEPFYFLEFIAGEVDDVIILNEVKLIFKG